MEEYRQKKPQPGPHGAEAGALQHKIESSVCKSVQSKVDNILKDVEKLTDVEKLYLYLKLPSGPNNGSDKCDQSSLTSSRTQQTYAFSWIQNHLEEHPDTSLPKQEVYDEYKSYCDNLGYHPLSAADFGKIMKNVFPNMKARRLGMRGKSKYCYSGLRKKAFVHLPSLPNLDVHKMSDGCEVQESSGTPSNSEDEVRLAACSLVCEWAQKVLSRPFDCVENLARYLLNSQYIGTKSVAALTVMTGMSTGTKTVVQPSAFVPTDEARTFQPQVKTLPSPTIDAKQQLQRKIQKKQQEQKLQSPLPCEAQARRMEVGTHCTGPSIPSGSPALLSPQPTIGIVVAAVPSPITVPRSRQLTSPSPVATAENKVLPVNFQVVSQPIQSVKQTPKTPQSVSGSPVCERLASRPRYPQILPKPSATGALTLRSPQTLLITNSPIKTVVPTPHVAPINVVKMTAISLSATGNTSTAALRPILTGVTGSGLAEDQRQAPQVQRGSAGNRQSPLQSPVPTKSVCMATTSAVDVKMEAIANNQALAADQLNASQEVFGDQKGERGAKPRAASEPAPCTKGAPGTDGTAKSKCGEKSPVNSSTVAASAGSNNNKNNGERALYLTVSSQNTSITLSSHPMSTTTPPKESSLAPRSLRKRPGAGLESIPVKKVFIAHQPVSSAESTVAELKKVPQLVTLARPESAPATTTCKVTVKLNSTVPTRILACSDSPLGNPSTFQTAANLQASPQLKGDEPSAQSDGSELAYGAIPTTSSQALLKDMGSSSLAMQSNLIDTSILDDLKNSIWEEGQLGSLQQQAFVGQMLDHKSVSTPVIDQLPMEPQGPPSNELTLQSGVDFTGSQPSVDYFPFNDDDMTQDSIVEELVQMEEQMKLNSLHSYSGCAEVALQSQSMVGQGTILSTHQMGTPFYQSLHSSTTPTLTPTPTPTPTSEMMGVGAGLTRESPCSQLAPTTPVDGSFGSNHHTPIGTPHSNCSTSVPPSPVDSCRNPFAFTPINSSITGYHNASIVSSSPLKPMQRPTATHPNKAKLEWMNSEYNSDSGTSAISNNGISIFPSYQNSVEDQFRKPHAFAIPGQSHQSQSRHDSNFRHLIPVSPVPQHTTAVIGQGKEEGFAVPAPLDNKIPCSSSGGTFRCRSVSPAVRQRNLSGSTIHSSATVCPFNSPATPEVLHIFASSCSDVDSSNMAQRSQSVPLNVMMQTEMLPMQTTTNSTKITSVLLSKMDPDGDDAVRGLGVNNMPSNYTARMNLTQILETTSTFRGGAGRQTPTNEYANRNPSQFQKPSYLTKMARNEQMILSSRDTQAQMSPREQQPELQQETQLEPTCANQQPVDFDSTVKDLLGDDSLNPSSNLVGHVASELSSVASDFSSDLRFTSELPSSINDLDTNLLFDSSHQQEQYDDSTLDELKNDPLFQQICTENSATFDWLESKDQHTVEMLG